MGKIYLIRHAEAEGNLYRRVHGWYDSPLTRRGLEQVKALETRFREERISAVYSSDLRRAKATAQALAHPQALPIFEDPSLRELHMGIYEDYPIGEMEFSHAELYQFFRSRSPQWHPPEGESYRQVCARMLKAFFTIAQRHPEEMWLFSPMAPLSFPFKPPSGDNSHMNVPLPFPRILQSPVMR